MKKATVPTLLLVITLMAYNQVRSQPAASSREESMDKSAAATYEHLATAIIAIFVVFSGLDAVPVLARHALSIDVPSDGVTPADHLEAWAGLFQYSSHITQLFWVPQHAIPGWAFVGLYLLWQRGRVGASLLVCVLPYLGYWSPFAAMGAAPFVLYATASDLIGRKIGRFDVIAVLLAAVPASLVGIYLVQGSGTVEHGFLFDAPGFWNIYFPFICIEFIPYVALIVAMRPAAIKDPGTNEPEAQERHPNRQGTQARHADADRQESKERRRP